MCVNTRVIIEHFFWKAHALLIRSQKEDTVEKRCIEAFKTNQVLENSEDIPYGMNDAYLALCYLQRSCSFGYRYDKEIGVQYLMNSCCFDYSFPFEAGLLFEKGSLSRREFEKIRIIPYELPGLTKMHQSGMLKDFFLSSSTVEFRIPRNAKAAFDICSDTLAICGQDTEFARIVANRIGMMHHRAVDDFTVNFSKAEEMCTRQ